MSQNIAVTHPEVGGYLVQISKGQWVRVELVEVEMMGSRPWVHLEAQV